MTFIKDDTTLNPHYPHSKIKLIIIPLIVGVIVFVWLLALLFVGPFTSFPEGKIVKVQSGSSVKQIANHLNDEGIVYSGGLFAGYISLVGRERGVVSGHYYFEEGAGFIEIGRRITKGDFRIKPLKITFPEGFNAREIGERIAEKIPDFDLEEFLTLTKNKEGYLFPDTYFFLPDATPESIIKTLEDTYKEKSPLKELGETNPALAREILIIASLIQKEVKEKEDMKIAAAIIQKRRSIGMSLQIDATLAYVTGRDSLSLTVDDLKSKDPFNSYTNLGLPPTPISNPGIDALEAAYEVVINKTTTPFLFFLTDPGGKVYYAKTHDEHVRNKKLYLR